MNIAALAALAKGDIDNALVAATPGGIEAQEAAGQATLIANAQLPKEFLYCTREQFERMGIRFGEVVDEIFLVSALPNGWSKRPTSHSMWSELIDDKGRKRAAIFYKAAFYDRKAHISLVPRYSVDHYVPCNADGTDAEYPGNSHMKTTVKDCGVVIHEVAIREDGDYETGDAHNMAGRAWLDTHFPEWGDPLAYWD